MSRRVAGCAVRTADGPRARRNGDGFPRGGNGVGGAMPAVACGAAGGSLWPGADAAGGEGTKSSDTVQGESGADSDSVWTCARGFDCDGSSADVSGMEGEWAKVLRRLCFLPDETRAGCGWRVECGARERESFLAVGTTGAVC